MFDNVIAHTSFIGKTGYANHSRNFFTELNKHVPVRVRNFSHDKDISYLTNTQNEMLIYQKWSEEPYEVGTPFKVKANNHNINIVLNETNHYYFYDPYDGLKIAYNVWESTRQPETYFNKLLEFDQLWVPTEWQRKCSIEQGYPEDKVKVLHEGVNPEIFKPVHGHNFDINKDTFRFLVFGRWDYRKSIKEIIQAFVDEFKPNENVELLISVDNPFPSDGMKTTEERLKHYNLIDDRIKVLHFPSDEDYVKLLQTGQCFVSCSRAEGWNLPLIEAISCGIPTICSAHGSQMEFAKGISYVVPTKEQRKPKEVFMYDGIDVPGTWDEPNFKHLQKAMRHIYIDYDERKSRAVRDASYVREHFSWERVTYQTLDILNEIYSSNPKPKPIKLNLGCGNDIRKGYINIDTYNNKNGIDLNCDIRKLPYEDEEIDEIFISHVMEHFAKDDVNTLLKEFNRVLKIDGLLDIRVPDFQVCVNTWNNSTDKWGALEHIFGGQTHEGNYHFCGYTNKTLEDLVSMYGFKIESNETLPNPISNDPEIILKAVKVDEMKERDVVVNCHFVDSPFVEIHKGSQGEYRIEMYDKTDDAMVHSTTLQTNHWTRSYRKYFTDWNVKVKRYGHTVYEHDYDAEGKRVLIIFDTKGLGDTIAWMPCAEEFRIKHKCTVILSMYKPWIKLFKKNYPEIEFTPLGQRVENLYASYSLGCRDENKALHDNRNAWTSVPLQQVGSDYLGLEYNETKPEIVLPKIKRIIKGDYVCLSEHSTAKFKYWNHPQGWQTVVNHIKNLGYKVVVISKEGTILKNIINKTNNTMDNTINIISNAKLFLGVSSGPSWLAWALNVPVVMISGCTSEWAEFENGMYKVINKNVCHGCFNDQVTVFDKSDWNHCPLHKNTERQFECTKEIYPKDVTKVVDKIINSK